MNSKAKKAQLVFATLLVASLAIGVDVTTSFAEQISDIKTKADLKKNLW